MHMANELINPAVAGGSAVIAASWLGWICKKARKVIDHDKFALMGLMGAFVFAAQMINFPLPLMPGTSGHLVGAVLLAIVFGPFAGAIIISSVVIVQCLVFQDGGILALGCNVINMALVPSFLGYAIYRSIAGGSSVSQSRVYVGAITASVVSLLAGAVLVVAQAAISGVVLVPVKTFMVTMLGVHTVIGLMEGGITAAVLASILNTRPDVMGFEGVGSARVSHSGLHAGLAVATLLVAGSLSWYASGNPDGLEWSYAERPDQPEFEAMVQNDNETIHAADKLHSDYSLMPDYGPRDASSAATLGLSRAWTSFAGVTGSIATMGVVYVSALLLRKRKGTHASS
ncbi:Energy-coupling factor transporter probable substrate-capture protein NikMN [Anaerohalosphaera lusitana]|uniref:Energy-coupling factor transporter probable substrate-capture protein NikMN n=1 Tax=Anaerohalosphaera lusitana TaxID=1936003 RepID=A0A1U9NKN5_9BACT|nr:energy-coupling factor ABC transporter permease [Anaerohalosphaera lusitana]AQT68491.1 Energy-coupling factor transporter probable substrate-capture protein NikMN [Anaerohalosphaera lusitana]